MKTLQVFITALFISVCKSLELENQNKDHGSKEAQSQNYSSTGSFNQVLVDQRTTGPTTMTSHGTEDKSGTDPTHPEPDKKPLPQKAKGASISSTDFPYSVVCVIATKKEVEGQKETRICSGSLVTLEWILTAAQCVQDAAEIQVFAGSDVNALTSKQTTKQGKETRVSKEYYGHPQFNKTDLDHDIGLIKVSPPFIRSKHIQPIKLSDDQWKNGDRQCSMATFGSVRSRIKGLEGLEKKMEKLDLEKPCGCGKNKEADGRKICLKSSVNFELCPCDLGGGLICNGEISAVSSRPEGFHCGDVKKPGVFQDTWASLNWISNYVPASTRRDAKKEGDKEKSTGTVLTCSTLGVYLIALGISLFFDRLM